MCWLEYANLIRGSHCLCVDMDIDGMEVCSYVL